jgi:hypothetical protein
MLHLAYRPENHVRGIIAADGLTQSTCNMDRSSSLGNLDKLPLTYKSSMNASPTSSLSMPMYRTLVQRAPYILRILNRAKLLNLHSITAHHASLCSEKCKSRGAYGQFLLVAFRR